MIPKYAKQFSKATCIKEQIIELVLCIQYVLQLINKYSINITLCILSTLAPVELFN